MSPKKADIIRVVYLIGAGASQGELSEKDPSKGILMSDIATGMSLKIRSKNIKMLWDVNNELSTPGIDVEHLITLYEASGTKKHSHIAKRLKELFREEIEEKINELGVSFFPTLFSSLIDMHSIQDLDEELKGILTLNYEDLIEQAMQSIKGGINYSIKIINYHNSFLINEDNIPILKLHGSFNWKNEYPISVKSKIKQEEDVLWIPPGVVKRREIYPFSLIWGKAKELLECDILRIIGCSLSRNDWELVSLLYSTQKLRTDKKQYKIELIDYPLRCDELLQQYIYLNMTTFLDIPEVRKHLINQYFPKYAEHENVPEEVLKELKDYITPDRHNIFAIWLRAKGENLLNKGFSIKTGRENIFEKFVLSGLGYEEE